MERQFHEITVESLSDNEKKSARRVTIIATGKAIVDNVRRRRCRRIGGTYIATITRVKTMNSFNSSVD